MTAYYNEFDPYAAAWLRNLIAEGLIAACEVDERSIAEVHPDDLRGYTQCHFFAGIGGWSLALRLAGWPDDTPVWTGSCPCQPFSTAGRRKGKNDERHLWPTWYALIRECAPPTVFGEQVAAAITHKWLDEVALDLEAEGYAVGAAVLPACSVGAPHKRDRLWFVGDSQYDGPHGGQIRRGNSKAIRDDTQGSNSPSELERASQARDVANAECVGQQGQGQSSKPVSAKANSIGETDRPIDAGARRWEDGLFIDCPDRKQRLIEPSIPLLAHGVSNRVGRLRAYGNAIVPQVAAEFIRAYLNSKVN